MASYVVMEPPGRRQEEARFVRDGFAFFGLIFPVLWLLWHRLWIEALIGLAVLLCIGAIGELTGWNGTAMLISFLASLYVALEGQALRVWALKRRGWRERGVIDAADEDEAMTRYYSGDGEYAEDDGDAGEAPASYVAAPSTSSGPALGLLSYPVRR
jgi:hypothetical protein